MTRKTILALLEQATITFADNVTGNITAADMRGMFTDVIETFSPGYGIMSVDSLTLPALGITPKVITYNTILAQTQSYIATPMAGTITRLAEGLPTTVNRVSFYADVAAPTGDEIIFSLFRNGVDIPGGTTCSGQGLGNFVQASFSTGTTTPDAANYTYDVRATKVTGGADDVQLSNVRFIFESVPTIGI
jgi:hypothetical protein